MSAPLPTIEEFRDKIEEYVERLIQLAEGEMVPPTLLCMDAEHRITYGPILFLGVDPGVETLKLASQVWAAQAGSTLIALVLDGERVLAPDGSANAQHLESGGNWDDLPRDDCERHISIYLEDCTGAAIIRMYHLTAEHRLDKSPDLEAEEEMLYLWWPLLPHNQLRQQASTSRQN